MVLWTFMQFSKAAGRIKESITSLPIASKDDDAEEAATLNDLKETTNEDNENKLDVCLGASAEGNKMDESDPFGLDAFMSHTKKDERAKGKTDTLAKMRKEEDQEGKKSFLKGQRESLIICLEIAARRYKIPW